MAELVKQEVKGKNEADVDELVKLLQQHMAQPDGPFGAPEAGARPAPARCASSASSTSSPSRPKPKRTTTTTRPSRWKKSFVLVFVFELYGQVSPSCGGFSYHREVAVASNDSSRFITEKKTSTDPIHLVFDTLKRVSGNVYGDPRSAAAATAGGAVTSSPTKETDLSCAHSDLDVLHRVDCIFSVLWLVSVFFSSPPRQVSGRIPFFSCVFFPFAEEKNATRHRASDRHRCLSSSHHPGGINYKSKPNADFHYLEW